MQDGILGSANTSSDVAVSDFWVCLRGLNGTDADLIWGTAGNTSADLSDNGAAFLGKKTIEDGAAGGKLTVNFQFGNFNAGTSVFYEVIFNGVSKGFGTFNWSNTNANYIGLDGRGSYIGYDSIQISEIAAPYPPPPANAGKPPLVPAWSIAQLLAWSPASDPDAPFNVSSVPLAPRADVPAALKANANARSNQGRIQILETFNSNTSGNPAQGGEGSRFVPTFWQYASEAVYWGGSASEGIVVPPSGEITDAAHRNGVPMLGTVFFPPTVFGGNVQWVRSFIQRSGDTFPAADKLIEAANYFGFDGWFINQETAGCNATDAAAMRDLIKYIRDNSNLKVVWYDSMTESGNISWQDSLTSANDWYLRHNYTTGQQTANGSRVAESIFLDFVVNSTTAASSRSRAATTHGLDPYASVYAGFELQEASFKTATGARQNLATVFPPGQDHILSAGLFIPRTHMSGTSDQELFWSGSAKDPRDTSTVVGTGNWRGIAHNIAARTPIRSVPFATSFNIGRGDDFYADGVRIGRTDWWNRGLQDVLPTWRWIIDSAGAKLTPQFDESQAYAGGSCLRFQGNLNSDNIVRLYLTELPVQADTRLKLAFKRGIANVGSQMQVGISFSTSPTEFVYFDAGPSTTAGWNVIEIPLGAHAGQTIAAVGLKFLATPVVASYDLRLGQLAFFNDSAPLPSPPSDVTITRSTPGPGMDTLDLRIAWNHAPGAHQYYNIFRRDASGDLVYLGSTPDNAFFASYVPATPPPKIVVVTVGADYRQSVASDQVGGTFATWAQQQFGDEADNPQIAGPGVDPDRDQLANLLEYAFLLNPLQAEPNPVAAERVMIEGSEYLRLTVAKNPAATDVELRVEATNDLTGTWGTEGTTVEADTDELLQVRDSTPIGTEPNRYLRVRAVLSQP